MTSKFSTLRKQSQSEIFYGSFDQLDGRHPLQQVVPEGHVSYRVRKLENTKILYFNFFLAKEMGLIPTEHPHVLNSILETKLKDTFALQIINEYDELTQRRIDPSQIKPNKFMATRYLQIQHPSRVGKTSGDGRGIWNGVVSHDNTTWDISSRGTGVTCLAPGSVKANQPLKTGDTSIGYGCGQAEMDELLGAAILAEVIHLQGIHTERVLCVIDCGNGYGIGVRAAPNLLRPAHFFLYLKQNRFDDLKNLTDFHIKKMNLKGRSPYDEMINKISTDFGTFIAKLDVDYIFSWLDWDGDNVLVDAGIIDYGSVRQFGLRHDKYRYDDVERLSTNLNEQKLKARQIIQVFAQMVYFLKTKKKKSLKFFSRHSAVRNFEQVFKFERENRILYRLGFDKAQRSLLLKNHRKLVQAFDKHFSFFERAKVTTRHQKVADGINCPPLFNVRKLLSQYPLVLSKQAHIPSLQFLRLVLSKNAQSEHFNLSESLQKHIHQFQSLYKKMLVIAKVDQKNLIQRASLLNSDKRITGNALIEIVDEIIQATKRDLPPEQVQKIIDKLILMNLGYPEVDIGNYYAKYGEQPAVNHKILSSILLILNQNRESI